VFGGMYFYMPGNEIQPMTGVCTPVPVASDTWGARGGWSGPAGARCGELGG